ncbi:MAG: hypothetical protein KDC92_08950 [Bacteroidetes bacterium]|nr:hypothetical protein [Bacteroidota bacterium]
MKNLLLLSLSFMFFMMSCNKSEIEEPNNNNNNQNTDYLENASVTDFYPLKVGNWWEYEVSKYVLSDGPENATPVGTERVTIGEQKNTLGHEFYTQLYNGYKDQIPQLIREADNQLYTESVTFLSLFLGKPIESGSVKAYGTFKTSVRRYENTYDVPAGTFDKLIYRDQQFNADEAGKPSLQLADIYAKGVGRIFFEDIDVEGCLCNGGTPVVYVYKLKDYHLE